MLDIICPIFKIMINPMLAKEENTGEVLPNPKGGETFILKREDIAFEVKLPANMGKLKAKGVFYFTSQRMVFVCQSARNRNDFDSFEVPLQLVTKHSFEQPIFGANYLSMNCNSADESVMVGTSVTSFSFHNGGCGTFLPIFFRIMAELKKQGTISGVINGIFQQNQTSTAYCDQDDPSVLYVVQPKIMPEAPACLISGDPIVG